MNNRNLYVTLQIALLIVAQILIFNHIRIFTYFIPIVYFYPIIKLPIRTKRWVVILTSAILGLLVDTFMNTPGLNMAASIFGGYLRTPLLLHFIGDDLPEEESAIPSFEEMRSMKYLGYLFFITSIHISTLLLIEAFSLDLYYNTMPYILGAMGMTFPIFLILDAFRVRRS